MIDIFCRMIMKNLKINRFIETGTWKGETVGRVCMWFSEMYPDDFGEFEKMVSFGELGPSPWDSYILYPVVKAKPSNYKIYSVEIKSERYEYVKNIFRDNPNITIKCQHSVDFLRELIDSKEITNDEHRCFFYLDAHGDADNPLREEIIQVLRLTRAAIVIDDFVVPGHESDWGYIAPNNIVYNWKNISDLFGNKKVTISYPLRSNEGNRGWILLLYGYPERDLPSFGPNPGQLPMYSG